MTTKVDISCPCAVTKKKFKIEPKIVIVIMQVENGMKSNVGRHGSLGKYPGAGKTTVTGAY